MFFVAPFSQKKAHLITRFPFKIGKKQDEKLRDINVPKKKKVWITRSKKEKSVFCVIRTFRKEVFCWNCACCLSVLPFFCSNSQHCSPVCFMLRKKRKKNKSRMKNYGITRSKKEKSTDNTFQKSWKLKYKNIWDLCWNYINSCLHVGTKKLLQNNHNKKMAKKKGNEQEFEQKTFFRKDCITQKTSCYQVSFFG